MSSMCTTLSTAGLERVHYFPRQLITADDMLAEQEYFRQKLRRHNRFLHGWGTVCGLAVTAAPTTDEPWRVRIDAGYALGPYGDEIYVAEPLCIDLAKCGLKTVVDPCEPNRPPSHVLRRQERLYVAIKYAECPTRPVRVHPAGCACDETDCEYSRIRDDFEIACLEDLPASHGPDRSLGLCQLIGEGQLPSCPPCPEDPWVVLAAVTLPAVGSPVTDSQIDNLVRRPLVSTAVLQQQLIDCCCQRTTSDPLQVISVRFVAVTPTGEQTSSAGVINVPPLPTKSVLFKAGEQVNVIELIFNRPVSHDGLGPNGTPQSMQVELVEAGGGSSKVSGDIYLVGDCVVRFLALDPDIFSRDWYRLIVQGNQTQEGPAVTAQDDGSALDGDYDNVPGGHFVLAFEAQ